MRFLIEVCKRWSPWVVGAGANTTVPEGLVFEFYKFVEKSLNSSFEYHYFDNYNEKSSNGSWAGQFALIESNDADALGPAFFTESRSEILKYGPPFFMSRLVIMSGIVPAEKKPFMIFAVFRITVWLLIFFALLVVATTSLWMYQQRQPSNTNRKRSSVFYQFLWSFFMTVMGKEFGRHSRWYLRPVWHSVSFRCLFGFWLSSCLVLMYTYQGTATSTYASDKMRVRVSSLRELEEDATIRVGTFDKSYIYSCLSKLENTSFGPLLQRIRGNLEKMRAPDVAHSWLKPIEDNEIILISEQTYTKHAIGQRFKETGKCGIRLSEIPLCTSHAGLGFRKTLRTDIVEKFSQKILLFNEAGLKHFKTLETVRHYDQCTRTGYPGQKPLTFEDLLGAFVVWISGVTISIVLLLIELTHPNKE